MTTLKDMYRTALQGNKPVQVIIKIQYGDGSNQEVVYHPSQITERYGTNPHQLFRLLSGDSPKFSVRQVKEGKGGFSLTNIEDAYWAAEFLKYCDRPACAVMKHENPCGGAALGNDALDAFMKAWWVDWVAAFGSAVGFNYPITRELAAELVEKATDGKTARYFIEAIAAPEFEEGSLGILQRRNDLRALKYEGLHDMPKYREDAAGPTLKTIGGLGDLLAFEDRFLTRIRTEEDFLVKEIIVNNERVRVGVVTNAQPTQQQLRDLRCAWPAAYVLRSNAVAIFKDGVLISPGTGQQDRERAVRHAINRHKELGKIATVKGLADFRNSIFDYGNLDGAVLASEAFFPYRDSIDAIGNTGIGAVAETGGSTRDQEVIDAANEYGIAIVFTGERCFRH